MESKPVAEAGDMASKPDAGAAGIKRRPKKRSAKDHERSTLRLLEFQKLKQAVFLQYASCKLRAVLWRAVRNIRHARMWQVHNEWIRAQVDAYTAGEAMSDVESEPSEPLVLSAAGSRLRHIFHQSLQRLRWQRMSCFCQMWEIHVDPGMWGHTKPGPKPELGPLSWPDHRSFLLRQAENWFHMASQIRDFRFPERLLGKRSRDVCA